MKTIQWACPYCAAALTVGLECFDCGFAGYVKNGMHYLHRSDDSWEKCLIERTGWIDASKERGVYFDNDDHFYMPEGRPHLREFYRESKAHLDRFLSLEQIEGRVCLDLGACLGWVEAEILKRQPEAQLIALEVNDDPLCGLGRSAALKNRFRLDFWSVVADMHHIPLPDNSVDVVFSVDALHHFRDLEIVLTEVHRVLRRGGLFFGLNEPDRPDDIEEAAYASARAELQVELRHKIIERRPTVKEYLQMGSILNLAQFNDEVSLPKNVVTSGLFLRGTKE